MAGIVRFPSGGSSKGVYCWERYKVLDDSTKEFDTFVVSSDETKYPDGDISGDFYYQRNYAESETVYLLTPPESDETVYAQLASQEAVTLTATPNDIRLGSVAVTEAGVVEGEKEIPTYHTQQAVKAIRENANFEITFRDDRYDYTALQAMMAPFNSSLSKSVAVDKVVIEDNVYNVNSTDVLSVVTKDHENLSINLGITNGSSRYVIRYFTYKEEI